jgi:hypothetical protein
VKTHLPDGLLVDVQRRLETFYSLDRQEPVTQLELERIARISGSP